MGAVHVSVTWISESDTPMFEANIQHRSDNLPVFYGPPPAAALLAALQAAPVKETP